MKRMLKYAGAFVAIVIMSFLALYFNNDIGINKVNIEKDARSSHKISDDWHVAKDNTEIMSAMIFYDESLSNHTFVFILPVIIGSVTIYDINGDVVESHRQGL